MNVLRWLAIDGIAQADTVSGPGIARSLNGLTPGDVYGRALNLYTRQAFLYGAVNAVMRNAQLAVDRLRPPAENRLWPFISIVQVALLRRPDKERGRTVYRGGLISAGDLEMLNYDNRMRLSGFTSCSRDPTVADDFLRWAGRQPHPGMTLAYFEIRLPNQELRLGRLEVGAAVGITDSAHPTEEEVLLIDGTTLRVDTHLMIPKEGLRCVQIVAEVDWEATVQYYRIFDNSAHA
jgi:hypothetical protein